MKISVIIPTCEAAEYIKPLIGRLKTQTVQPDEIMVVDSASKDGTVQEAQRMGARVVSIERSLFDHGGTRDMALRASTGDIVLFLTQDAVPADEYYIEHLTALFKDEQIAAVSGRQVARPEARAYEKLFRQYRYSEQNRIWDIGALNEQGIRSFQLSDVCSAYRRTAYESVGGFEHPLMTNEDMLIAADLLGKGYRLAYCANAVVIHSHDYTFMQEYRRNRLIGRFMQRYSHRLYGTAETGEGIQMVKYVVKRLLQKGQVGECCLFCLNCVARITGNRAGRRLERKAMANAKS